MVPAIEMSGQFYYATYILFDNISKQPPSSFSPHHELTSEFLRVQFGKRPQVKSTDGDVKSSVSAQR